MKLLGSPPLIVTLKLDKASAERFTAERKRHFPPARNYLDAHVTLFHKLPAERRRQLEIDLANEAGTLSAFTINIRGLRFLGRGVAYDLSSPDTEALRARLATQWQELLGPQDSQPIRPHVTIQNKVEPAAARQLRDELEARFIPFIVRGEGLDLWEYRGGPWAHLRTFLFAANGEAVEGTQTA